MYGMNVDREASGLNSGVLLSFEVQTDEKESGSTEVGKKPKDWFFRVEKKKWIKKRESTLWNGAERLSKMKTNKRPV